MSEGPCNTRARSFKARTGEHELLDGLKQRWRGLGADNNEFQNDGLQCAGYHIAKHDEENAIARAGITDRSAAIRRTCSEAAAQLHAALPGDGSSDILRREARTAVVDPSPSTSAPSAGEVPPPFKPWRTSRHPNQKRPTQHGSVDQRPPLAQQPCRPKHYQPDERRLYEQQPLETQQQQQELRRIGVSGPRSLYRSESAFPALFLEQIDGDSADRPSDHADVAGGLGGRQQLEESVGRTVSLEQSALEALAAPFKVPHTPPRARGISARPSPVPPIVISPAVRASADSFANPRVSSPSLRPLVFSPPVSSPARGTSPFGPALVRETVSTVELSARGDAGSYAGGILGEEGDGAEEGEREFTRHVLGRPYAELEARYEVAEGELGRGKVGALRACRCRATGRQFACKTISKAAMIVSAIVSVSDSTFPIARIACKAISKAAMICEAECDEVRREVQMMQRARGHPRIVSMHEALEDARAVHIIMELCHGGELFHRIVTRQRYSEPAAASVARQLASALAFLHARGVAHRDVKPENILLCSRADDTSIKLTDFGAAALLLPENILLCSRTDDTSIKLTDFGAAALLLPDRCFPPPSSLHPFPSPHSPLPHFPHLIRLRPLSIPPSRPTSPPLPLPSAHSPLHILSTIPLQPSPFPHPAPAHPPPSIPHSPFPLVSTPHYTRTMHRASGLALLLSPRGADRAVFRPPTILLRTPHYTCSTMHRASGLAVLLSALGTQCTERVGSPYYLAPEVLTEQYGLQADVWSAGVVLFVLLSGSPPFFSPFTCACFFLPKPAAHPFPPGTQCTERVGSPYYLAPEVLSEQYGLQADVWSAGVVLFVLLSGSPPFFSPFTCACFFLPKPAAHPFSPGTQCTERVGSPYYLAPEVLTEQYGLQADVWSAGVVLFVLLSGSPPFFSPFTCACFFLPKPAAHPFPPGTQCTERVGSPYYLAPEVLSEQYGLQADVWSAGVVLFVLLSGSPPFSGRSNDEIFQAVRCKEIDLASKPWPSISEGAKDLVRRMLTRDPEARITMKEVLGEWVGCLG
ncbi:unnamed protein product [Closterium sp. Naga37s-1]|nr:unnamed protein product [Closterium sp. Naga37s-1]